MGNPVYSTEHGRLCPQCGQAKSACRCAQQAKAAAPAGDGIVRISRETKGRKGKGATVVRGLGLSVDELKVLAKALKQQLSTGGSVKGFDLEFQGDQRDRLKGLLEARGFRVKLAGG